MRPIAVLGLLSSLLPSPALLAVDPATLQFSDLSPTYDGTGKRPVVTTDPPGLPVAWWFLDPAAPPPQPVTSSVFNNFPPALPLSFNSLSFSAQRTWGLGDYVAFGGTARDLVSVDVALVTWAKAANYPDLAAADPAGWPHPITISLYTKADDGTLTFRGERTHTVFIPWRPVTLANGNPYPYNGYAFRAHVPFPAGVTLPEQAMILVSFNTQNTGFTPTGQPGPFNELNVAIVGNPPYIGTDIDPTAVLWVREDSWSYPTLSTPAPLFEVKASATPAAGTTTPPVNAGRYTATATISDPAYSGSASTPFTILPAAAQVLFADLVQVADGTPKSPAVTTLPAGLPVGLLFDDQPSPPTNLGSYTVTGTISDPNHTGTATASFRLGHDLASWLQPWVVNGTIPADSTGEDQDPESDSVVNLLEYAFGLDPSSGSHSPPDALPRLEQAAGGLALIYRKNLSATDLTYSIEVADDLSATTVWVPTDTVDSIVSTAGEIQVIRALLPEAAGQDRRFARVWVVRPQP